MKKIICSRKTAVILIIIAVFAVEIAGQGIASAAEKRQIFTPKSYGRFIYDDGDASNNNGHEYDLLLDAADFTNISESLSSLAGVTDGLAETAVRKTDIIDSLDAIKDNTNEGKAAGANAVKELIQAFQDGVNKIYDKLAGLGFTPITNSPEGINNSIQDIYDSRYSQGYTDGLGQVQSANARITYTYHEHSGNSNGGGCYTVLRTGTKRVGCDGDIECRSGPYGPDTSGNIYYAGVCPKCDTHEINYFMPATVHCPNGSVQTYTYYDLGCGMSTNTIISAVVEFDY